MRLGYGFDGASNSRQAAGTAFCGVDWKSSVCNFIIILYYTYISWDEHTDARRRVTEENATLAENWEKLCGEIDKNLAENWVLIFGTVMGL